MVRQIIIKVRKKGQITLPAFVRKQWNLQENDEIILILKGNEGIIKPKKIVSVKDIAGRLGHGDEDEIEFAVTDPALLPDFYQKKYGDSK